MHSPSYEIRWGVKIPLRDGVLLNATAYLPIECGGPAACVLTLTPYIADTYHERGAYFAARGIPFLIVDVRGRGNSEGQFKPLAQEAEDGYDVVEWIAAQEYCNGKVGMWGGSYSGYNQWATAKECPPHLATIVPAAAAWPGIDFPMRNNIFYPYTIQWLAFTAGKTAQGNIFLDSTYWANAFRRWHCSGASFRKLDAMLGVPSEEFQEWIRHPEVDPYWESFNPTPEQYERLELPILTITGIYDDDQPGALEHYRRHCLAGSRANHYLIIGPWDHAGTRTPKAEVGGIRFGNESLLDLPNLHREWYAWTMGDGPRPPFLRGRVAYYVTGRDRWRFVDRLGDATGSHTTLFLASRNGTADSVFASGSLGKEPSYGVDQFVYDPRDITGSEIDAMAQVSRSSLVDQSLVLALGGKCLVCKRAAVAHG